MRAFYINFAFITIFANFGGTASVTFSNSAVLNAAKYINPSVSPCEDFYEYACGNWKHSNPKPPYRTEWSTSAKVRENALKQYKNILQKPKDEENDSKFLKYSKRQFIACLEDGSRDIQIILEIISELGGWPLLQSTSWNDNVSWWKLIGNVKSSYGLDILLKLEVNVDSIESSKNILYVDQVNPFGMPEIFMDPNLEAETKMAYIHLMRIIVKQLGNPDESVTTVVNKKIKDVIEFGRKLVQSLSRNDERYKGATFLSKSAANFKFKDRFDFDEYLIEALASSGRRVEYSDKIAVIEPNYINKMLQLIARTSKETVANFIVWRVIMEMVNYSNEGTLSNAIHEFGATFNTGYLQEIPRDDVCASLSYGEGVAQKYFLTNFDPRVQSKVELYTELIKEMTSQHISESTLSLETKIKAQKKLSSIIQCIGYPSWFTDMKELDKRFGNDFPETIAMNSERKENFLQNLLFKKRVYSNNNLKQLRKPFVKNCEWSFSPSAHFGAYYDGPRNTINLPLPLMKPPFFSLDAPDAMNFGSFGFTVGHEIAHSLPQNGWTKTALGHKSALGVCLVGEYQRLSRHSNSTQKSNVGLITLNENFADNVGVQMSYWTYKKLTNSCDEDEASIYADRKHEFTQDQLFFIAVAQKYCESSSKEDLRFQTLLKDHSIGKERVLGSLRNFAKFSEVFSCPLGTFMNPVSKCAIFNYNLQPKQNYRCT